MTAINWLRGRWLLGAVGVGLLSGGAAVAEVPVERPGSLLLFPKVVNTAARTTVIEISNSGNMLETVKCFYVRPDCSSVDFDLLLTRQHPTAWPVGSGRRLGQDGGLFPGLIPPVADGFEGALICGSVDPTQNETALINSNKLKGRATIEDTGSGNESIYNGIPVYAHEASGTNVAELNGTVYEECPADLHLDTFGKGFSDPVIGENGTVATGLTLLSCDIDLSRISATPFHLFYRIWNEFEQQYSRNDDGQCLYFRDLDDVFNQPSVTPYNAITVRASDAGGLTGVAGVAEFFHIDLSPPAPRASTAARTLHDVTEEYPSTEIILH